MKISYKKPVDFMEIEGVECFKSYPKLEEIITCAGNQLHSKDKEFITFIPIYRPLTVKDSIDIKRLFPNSLFYGVDRLHEGNIRVPLEKSLGKAAGQHWKEYVDYYSTNDAKDIFNADSAISFSIKLGPDDYYQKKYNHLDALFLIKKGRGYVNLFCFYTDKAEDNFSYYWKAIEGVFKYE